MSTNLPLSNSMPTLDVQIHKRFSENNPISSQQYIGHVNQLPSLQSCDNVIEKASELIQNLNLAKITFDQEPSMVKRVRKLTPDGVLRVAETLCAIAGKLGMTHKVLFEKLPQGILSIPSPHDRRIKDEALISRAETLISSLNAIKKCFEDLQNGIESELKLLSKKEPFCLFADQLMKYQDFYWTAFIEIKRISEDSDCLLKELIKRSKFDIKGSKEREFPTKNLLEVFSYCYGLKSTETLNTINLFYKRSDEITNSVHKLKKAKAMMEYAHLALRKKYNYFAYLCTKEIYPDEKVNVSGTEKTAFEAFESDSKNFLIDPLLVSNPGK